MVSTGVDSRDGNTVGDDRKSSKTRKCKRKYIQAYRSQCRVKRQRIRSSGLRTRTCEATMPCHQK
jgi:hypothetical protein